MSEIFRKTMIRNTAVGGCTMAVAALIALAGLGAGIQRAYADNVPVRERVDVARFLPSGELIFPSNIDRTSFKSPK